MLAYELGLGLGLRFRVRAVPEIILKEGGSQALFCPVHGGEGVLLTTCPRGGGVTCPGAQGVFDP